MDEYVYKPSDTAPPSSINQTNKWVATSTYDVFMVDTTKNKARGNPNRRCKDLCNGGTGNSKASNVNTRKCDAVKVEATNGDADDGGARVHERQRGDQ